MWIVRSVIYPTSTYFVRVGQVVLDNLVARSILVGLEEEGGTFVGQAMAR